MEANPYPKGSQYTVQMLKEAAQEWLERRVHARDDVSRAVLVLREDESGQSTDAGSAASWPAADPSDLALIEVAKSTINRGQGFHVQSVEGDQLITKPISNGDRIIGAVAMRIGAAAANDSLLKKTGIKAQGTTATTLETSGTSIPASKPERKLAINIAGFTKIGPQGAAHPNVGGDRVLSYLQALLSEDKFDQAAATIATELAIGLEFDRVSIGLMQGRTAHVVAVSHSADIKPGEALLQSVQSAIEEAVDQSAHVIFPPVADGRPQITLSHGELSTRQNMAQVRTVLMLRRNEIIGAIVFEKRDFIPVLQETIDLIEHVADAIGPVLLLKRQQEQSWFKRIKLDCYKIIQSLYSANHRIFKMVTGALLIALLGLPAIPMEYRLSVNARLEGQFQRMVVAPVDGYLKTVHVRPGDTVKAGQAIADLSDDDLLMEKRRLESEVNRHEGSYGEALGKQDRSQLLAASSRVNEARAQLRLVESQLVRVHLVAPLDGIVTKGDLKQQLGAPVKRGDTLMVISPANDFRVIADVEDRNIEELKVGAKGELMLSALPKETIRFQVIRIVPVATQRDGKNLFEVEGRLVDSAQSLRPGMEGIAKLDAGQRSLYWMTLHRIQDWLRVTFWSWSH